MQDSPPGAATAALLARARTRDVPPGWLDDALEKREAIALYNARTATSVLPAADAAAYATALLPHDDAGLKAIVGPAAPDRREGFAEPVELAVAAISDALDGARSAATICTRSCAGGCRPNSCRGAPAAGATTPAVACS